ncbi:unnamed protein product [Oncorhynchus mykiss]|uniref:Uncharacterized protein n=1 Tax=Oncorhynchus mykiss TaxID=8022 RepID=A0A060YVC6_ONCMY|nr:unnamed protein product [Oncorhynchus mykiss]
MRLFVNPYLQLRGGKGQEVCVYFPQCVYTDFHLSLLQDCEQASCKMNSLGSNHSLPSTSVSTGSQSSSINSMQEVLDESCSDMTMMHHDYDSSLESSAQSKKDHRYNWDNGLKPDLRPELMPLSSDMSQAHNYRHDNFSTIKSASLVRVNTPLSLYLNLSLLSLYYPSSNQHHWKGLPS